MKEIKSEFYNSYDNNGKTENLNIRKLHKKIVLPRDKYGIDIHNYKAIFNDEGTRKIIREGNTIGCFYIESPGMRSLLKRLNCDTFEMLTAASSIIRPGVAESGMMQEFIERHKDPRRRKYLVPDMEKYLGETYGVMIYQEDVIKVAHHIAGLTLEEADLLRRAMSGKMRSHTAMQQIKNKFFYSSRSKGLTDSTASELWRQIESFAGYAFCKAHSASFALLSFQVAYLKVHFPAEFMASVLSNRGGYYSAEVYIHEAKRMGIKILLPCINQSNYNYSGKDNFIRIGLIAVKNCSYDSMNKIVKERESSGYYKSLRDFLTRTNIGYEETRILIKCGAMDTFGLTRPSLMRLLDLYSAQSKRIPLSYQGLFDDDILAHNHDLITEINYPEAEICRIEYETFDYMVTKHPLDFFNANIDKEGFIKSDQLANHKNKTIKITGWYMASKRVKTKKGTIMKFLSLEDLTGTFEAVLFPDTYDKFALLTLSKGPFIVEGKVDKDNHTNIIVSKLEIMKGAKNMNVEYSDSVENNYFGDVEIVTEDEMYSVGKLDKEKLRQAYVS